MKKNNRREVSEMRDYSEFFGKLEGGFGSEENVGFLKENETDWREFSEGKGCRRFRKRKIVGFLGEIREKRDRII